MRISEPRCEQWDDRIRFTAAVSFDVPERNGGFDLWFEFPARLAPMLSCSSDPFLAALILFGMSGGEDIRVAGPVSARLLSGLGEYQRRFHRWMPDAYQPISIIADARSDEGGARSPRAAASFSGGLDSFYTLWRHLPLDGHVPPRKLDYAMFMQGFDIPLDRVDIFAEAARTYAELLRPFGVELITVRTNLRRDRDVDWDHLHGAALAASAMFFAPHIGAFVIPSSRTPAPDAGIWGTDPAIDPLLSTESIEIIHDRSDVTRFDKIKAIGDWEPVRRHLRVCWYRPNATMNCSRCSKCCLTMLQLDVLGLLPRHAAFLPPDRRAYRRARFDLPHQRRCGYEILGAACQADRPDIMADVAYAMMRTKILDWLVRRPLRALRKRFRWVDGLHAKLYLISESWKHRE